MDSKIRKTINKKISLQAAISIIIIVIVSQILSALQLKNVMTEQSFELLQTKAANNADIIDNWINSQSDILVTMKDSLAYMDSLDEKEIMDYLEIQLKKNQDALMYYVCFAYNKSVLPADHSVIDLDPTTRGWWKQAVAKGGVIYTDPYVDFASGQMIVSIAAPFQVQGNQAVILADITIDRLLEIVNNISTEEDSTSFLLAEDGSVVTYPNKDYLPKEEGNTVLAKVLDINLDSNLVTEYVDYDKTKRYVSVSEVKATGWKIGVTQEQKTLSSWIQRCVIFNILKISLLAVIAIVILYLVLTKMLDPVSGIVDALLRISEGDFSVKLEESKQKDEIGILQQTTKKLTETLSAIIGDANRILGDMAAYNLTSKDMKKYPGDFNQLSLSVNSVKNILCNLLREVKQASSSVKTGSEQLASAADSLSQGSVTQSEAIQTLTEEIDSMIQVINQSSEDCRQANNMLMQLDTEIKTGNDEMDALMKAVEEVERMSADIQAVTETIDDIAMQTNILALNASVEAARAGSHGAGFAVVAEEIRKLAVNCANEAKKTSDLLEECLRAINETKRHADTTSGQLVGVRKNSMGIADKFQAIAEEMQAEAEDTDEIQSGIGHISDIVNSNTAASEETAAASEELSNQAINLARMIQKFVI